MLRNKTGRAYLYLMRHRGTARAEKRIRLPDDPRSPEFWAEYARLMQLPVAPVSPNAVVELVAAANGLLDTLSSMLSWSVPRGWRSDNPCREVRPLKGGDAYQPYPWAVIEAAKDELRTDLWLGGFPGAVHRPAPR
jgi:hypothetical protein